MRELSKKGLRLLLREGPPTLSDGAGFTEAQAREARRFHQSLPDYRETALVPLRGAAARYGVKGIYVKDESSRFGLKAFKGLGGSWAMFRILCERLGLDYRKTDFSDFQSPALREKIAGTVFATATDGNHGKGVSWAARLFGCEARVYMPAGSAEARRRAIEQAGSATALITPFNYDGTVDFARREAESRGWVLLQDTAWPGYEQIPRWIVEGYLTMAAEAARQLGGEKPTHVFLQAGVGAMAGGVLAYLWDFLHDDPPLFLIAEPEEAACVRLSVKAGDGAAHTVEGDPCTIMAGLNCGTPCSVVWPILRDGPTAWCACEDALAEEGMRAYARPEPGDERIVSGESGAVTYGLLRRVLRQERLRAALGLGKESVILLINTEGDTDPENYRRILERE